MAKTGVTGVKRIINACGYAVKGIKAAFKSEAAFRQEILAAIILIPASFFIAETTAEILLLIGSVFLVLVVEMINTAIEALADQISHEKHELLGKAKDCGSGAVLLALINAGVIWLVVILELIKA